MTLVNPSLFPRNIRTYILRFSLHPQDDHKYQYYISENFTSVYSTFLDWLKAPECIHLLLQNGRKMDLFTSYGGRVTSVDVHQFLSVSYKDRVYNVSSDPIVDEEDIILPDRDGELQGDNRTDIVFRDICAIIHVEPFGVHPLTREITSLSSM